MKMNSLNNNKKYIVHPDDPDVRGWDFEIHNKKAGIVNDLVMDTGTMMVKYLDILATDKNNNDVDHYLIPVSKVSFNRELHKVKLVSDNQYDYTYSVNDSKKSKYGNEVQSKGYNPENVQPEIRYSRSHENRFEENKNNESPNKSYEIDDKRQVLSNNKSNRMKEYEPDFENEYNQMKGYPGNWEEKVKVLQKQKELKTLEFERDIAIIDREIAIIKSKSNINIYEG